MESQGSLTCSSFCLLLPATFSGLGCQTRTMAVPGTEHKVLCVLIEDSTTWALAVADYLGKVRVLVTACLVMYCKVKSARGSLYPDVTLFYLNRKVPFWHCCSGVRLEVSGLMLIYPGQWLDRYLFPLSMDCVRAGVRKQVGSHLENRSGVWGE